jgi:hypothetical protein
MLCSRSSRLRLPNAPSRCWGVVLLGCLNQTTFVGAALLKQTQGHEVLHYEGSRTCQANKPALPSP